MARPATDRVKFGPPLGLMPALQYLLPAQLEIDEAYQRSLDTSGSERLIRRIAQGWNWDLCQPLVVARRDDGRLFVIDGQHRLAAARLRGDIAQLPAVVVQYANREDEAASFVHLNQQRKPLGKLDLFKAALASGDSQSSLIAAAMADCGLSVAAHQNYISWKPGQIANIAGIEAAWRSHGEKATRMAMRVMAQAFGGQVLRYAGTLFPGIAAVCADECQRGGVDRSEQLQTMLAQRSQAEWRNLVMQKRAEQPDLKFSKAAAVVIRNAWTAASGDADAPRVTQAAFDGKRWCSQCEMQVNAAQANSCRSKFCTVKAA